MSLTTPPAGYVADDHDGPWPPSLDLEPEQCWCLPHGAELPCVRCDELVAATPTKERPLCLI